MNPTLPARPAAVSAAFVGWLIATAFGFAAAIVLFVSAAGAVGATNSSLTGDFFGITFVFAGILVLALTAIQAPVVFRMRAGRNWARVTLTVLAVLQIVNAVFSIGLNAVLSIIGIVLVAVATVLMWVPASNRFFGRQTTVNP